MCFCCCCFSLNGLIILVTTYVFLVCPWVCHYKNVHVRCVKEMFPYLCPPSFSCTIIHSVLMVWAMGSQCGKVALTCSHVIFHLHRSPYVIFPPPTSARSLNVDRDGLTGCSRLDQRLSYSCGLKVKLAGSLWPGSWLSVDASINGGSRCKQFLMSFPFKEKGWGDHFQWLWISIIL